MSFSHNLDGLWFTRLDILSTSADVDEKFRLGLPDLLGRKMELDDYSMIFGSSRLSGIKHGVQLQPNKSNTYLSTQEKAKQPRNKQQMGFKVIKNLTNFELYECDRHQKGSATNRLHVRVKAYEQSMSRKHFKLLNRIFPYSSPADQAKTNLDLASIVYEACASGEILRVNEALSLILIGSYNITACAIVIQALGNPVADRMFELMRKDLACCMAPTTFYDYFKSITTALRRTIRWVDGSTADIQLVTGASYWEMCMGRATFKSNWADEKHKRTKCVVPLRLFSHADKASAASNAEYVLALERVMDNIMLELVTVKQRWTSWQEFGERRQSWVASGSAGAEYVIVEGEKARISKPAFFENMSSTDFDALLTSEPKILASASEKFEQSKSRAIYGTMPTDYAVMAYVILPLEHHFHKIQGVESSLRSLDEIACTYRRLKAISGDRVEGTMIDYSDFNFQHTLEAQSCIFRSLSKRLVQISAHTDVITASDWCAKACLNQYCRFPGDKKHSRIVQGMFSGVRGTHFINTILNVAYYRLARQEVSRHFNVWPIHEYTVHQGDDVWISNKSRLWAVLLYNVMKYNGFVFNDNKQLMAPNVGEFLRVWYSNGKASGYFSRAIGSLIQRPIQGSDLLVPSAHASSLNEQLMILSRRGMTQKAGRILWNATVPHALTLRIRDVFSVTIPKRVAMKRFIDGGLDLGAPYTAAMPCTNNAPIPGINYARNRLTDVVAQHTSRAWIRHMSRDVCFSFDAEAVVDTLHSSNLSGSMLACDKAIALRRHGNDLIEWKKTITCDVPNRCIDNFFAIGANDDWAKVVLSEARRQIESTIHSGLKTLDKTNYVATILGAIANSPFKDLRTAKTALKLPVLQTVLVAMSLCYDKTLRANAMTQFNNFKLLFSDEVIIFILTEDFSLGSHYNCYLHPVVVSWCTSRGAISALYKARDRRLTSLSEWKEEVFRATNSILLCACVDPFWTGLSKY